jgi:hypothetical protein
MTAGSSGLTARGLGEGPREVWSLGLIFNISSSSRQESKGAIEGRSLTLSNGIDDGVIATGAPGHQRLLVGRIGPHGRAVRS